MARTTEIEVQAVLNAGEDYDCERKPSLLPYIRAAHILTSRVRICASDNRGITLSAAELTEIETWLAAHFYVCSDQTLASENTGDASGSYHGQTGKGLESSRYGQVALDLDYSRCLAAITKGGVATGVWLGRPPSQQTDYDQRD